MRKENGGKATRVAFEQSAPDNLSRAIRSGQSAPRNLSKETQHLLSATGTSRTQDLTF